MRNVLLLIPNHNGLGAVARAASLIADHTEQSWFLRGFRLSLSVMIVIKEFERNLPEFSALSVCYLLEVTAQICEHNFGPP
jgi:hypothetical protein